MNRYAHSGDDEIGHNLDELERLVAAKKRRHSSSLFRIKAPTATFQQR